MLRIYKMLNFMLRHIKDNFWMPPHRAPFSDVILQAPLRNLSERQLKDYLHKCYGKTLAPSPHGRTYTCKCGKAFSFNGHDNHSSARLEHVQNAHSDWQDILLVFLVQELGTLVEHPLAIPMQLLGYRPTGDNTYDERAMAFLCCARFDLLFSLLSNSEFRAFLPFKTAISAQAVSDAGDALGDQVQRRINDKLLQFFGLLFDAWKGLEEHFLGVMAVFERDGQAQYLRLGCRPIMAITAVLNMPAAQALGLVDPAMPDALDNAASRTGMEMGGPPDNFPPIEPRDVEVVDYRLGAEAYLDTILRILSDYGKDMRNILFLFGDNAHVNIAFARLAGRPLIGCHAHLFNLGIKTLFLRCMAR